VLATVERLPRLREATFEDGQLRAWVDHGATAAPAVLAALDSAGMRVQSLTIARPSLDDVYLRYTGRAFEQADREGERRPELVGASR
jgi:ABC-2 type transport system ATP-binding protein